MKNVDQTGQEKPNNSTIKFTYAEGGEVSFNSGHTIFGDLFMLGAFASTAVIEYSGENAWRKFATDNDGLKSLNNKSWEVIEIISETVTSLGVILAYVDRLEVGDRHINNYAWLVAGLGELLSNLVRENQEIGHTLTMLSNQATTTDRHANH